MEIYGTFEEKKDLQKKASIYAGAGFIILAIIRFTPLLTVVNSMNSMPATGLTLAFIAAGITLWFWGLGFYCRSKGYAAILAVVGLFAVIGVLILAFIPDKFIIVAESELESPSNYPR